MYVLFFAASVLMTNAYSFMWTANDPKSEIAHFDSGSFFEHFQQTDDIWFLVFYNSTDQDDFNNWHKIKQVQQRTKNYCKIGAINVNDPMNQDWIKSLGFENTLHI